MPNESTKRFKSEPETPLGTYATPPQEATPAVDASSIAALRTFFELLDIWDQKENPLEK